jgi:GNAT superfamily N-acetyltransferase
MMLRPITVWDGVDIVTMLQTLRTESPEYNYVEDKPQWVLNNLERMLEDDVLFGVIDDRLRGFMIGAVSTSWYSNRVEGYEQLLYISPESRGGTLAVRLIKAFEDAMRDRGAKVLHVGASTGMQEDRTARLYQALGYTLKGQSLRKDLHV